MGRSDLIIGRIFYMDNASIKVIKSNQTIIGSDNGLSPGRRQAIIETNDGILLIGSLGRNFSEISIEISIQENAFESVVCEMAAILSRPQCDNSGVGSIVVYSFPEIQREMSLRYSYGFRTMKHICSGVWCVWVVHRLESVADIYIYIYIYKSRWKKCMPMMLTLRDDVIKWKHYPRYWPFARGIDQSPVDSPHKGQWRGVLTFSLLNAWTKVHLRFCVDVIFVRVLMREVWGAIFVHRVAWLWDTAVSRMHCINENVIIMDGDPLCQASRMDSGVLLVDSPYSNEINWRNWIVFHYL